MSLMNLRIHFLNCKHFLRVFDFVGRNVLIEGEPWVKLELLSYYIAKGTNLPILSLIL